MNNERRKRLAKIIEQLSDLKTEIEDVVSDEQDAFDNLPEGIQSSERGGLMEDAISTLTDAADEIDTVIASIEEGAA